MLVVASPTWQTTTPGLPLVLQRVGRAGRERHLPADDAVAAHEMGLGVEQVHRTAAAAGDAGLAAEQFGHHRSGGDAARQDVAVLAIVRVDVVVRRQRRHEADDGGLFTEVQMAIAADPGLGVHLARPLLEAADEQHLMIVVLENLRIFPGEIARAGRVFRNNVSDVHHASLRAVRLPKR